MSADAPRRGLLQWLDERYSVRPLLDFMGHKEVPLGSHSLAWYFLGGATLFFFVIQIASGALLLMYYQPGENTAYESIRYITTKVPFGWLVRSVHCWSAHLMTICLLVHMYSTFFLKAYRKPRELTWLVGYALFAITLTFGFSGYLLPWNELSFFATAVGTDSVKSIPFIGDWMLQVLRGGPEVSINTLYRFFALHVVLLPLAAFGVIGLHLLFVQRQGMALPVGMAKPPRSMKFFPNFALRDLLLWLFCLLLLVLLAAFLPYGPGIPGMEWELGKKADPLAPAYPGIKPEWYFLWVYQLLKEFPPHIMGMEGTQACMFVVLALVGVGALVPWMDRSAAKNRPSPAFTDAGVAALIFIAFLTFKAWDLGGTLGADDPESRAAVARFSAWIVLAGAIVITGLRTILGKYRWFFLSGAATLHAVLHGITGLTYLTAGAISLSIGILGIILLGRGLRPDVDGPGGHP
jgi:cytochrome b6